MRKSKFTRQQIQQILDEFDNGKSAFEINQQYGVTTAAFYKWRERYRSSKEPSRATRFKELQKENVKLKQMYANLALELEYAKAIIASGMKDSQKKSTIDALQEYGIRRAV